MSGKTIARTKHIMDGEATTKGMGNICRQMVLFLRHFIILLKNMSENLMKLPQRHLYRIIRTWTGWRNLWNVLTDIKGSTIQTVNALKDIGAGLKTLVGGELGNYNEMMIKARNVATDKMIV